MSLLSIFVVLSCLLSQTTAFSTPTKPTTWKDMPRKERTEVSDTVEIAVGRVAMVGSVLFLAEEILTGESILEQMMDAANVLVHTV